MCEAPAVHMATRDDRLNSKCGMNGLRIIRRQLWWTAMLMRMSTVSGMVPNNRRWLRFLMSMCSWHYWRRSTSITAGRWTGSRLGTSNCFYVNIPPRFQITSIENYSTPPPSFRSSQARERRRRKIVTLIYAVRELAVSGIPDEVKSQRLLAAKLDVTTTLMRRGVGSQLNLWLFLCAAIPRSV